jgi:hypothetical protein
VEALSAFYDLERRKLEEKYRLRITEEMSRLGDSSSYQSSRSLAFSPDAASSRFSSSLPLEWRTGGLERGRLKDLAIQFEAELSTLQGELERKLARERRTMESLSSSVRKLHWS